MLTISKRKNKVFSALIPNKVLQSHNHWKILLCLYSDKKMSKGHQITISDVTKDLDMPKNPELVPRNYVKINDSGSYKLSQSTLHHLRWMLQKDILKQDMFLIGNPGPLRRNIVMKFLELTGRELEYIALSRDTTESDLKQRREIKERAAKYFDQCAVRAAINGRVLVLDGVEHTERNVLPILNNLLENREMHLENGKFLVAPERFDELSKTSTEEELSKSGLLRVSENFRVIALGSPTQKYKGTPLDPPFRSRFQSRNVCYYSFEEILTDILDHFPNVPLDKITKIIHFGMSVNSSNQAIANLPHFPLDNVPYIAVILEQNPDLTVYDAICFMYPYESALGKESIQKIKSLMDTLKTDQKSSAPVKCLTSVKKPNNVIDFTINNQTISIKGGSSENTFKETFIDLDNQRNYLGAMLQLYSVGDFCLIGHKGLGKSTLTRKLISLLNQEIEPMVLYEDMTSRDLIQQRITTVTGDTVWKDSPLVRAAKNGTVAVLDGLQNVHKSTATILQRLVHDRELQLCDGTTLLREDRYQHLLSQGFSEHDLAERKIFKINDAFRIIALAEPLNPNSTTKNWLANEVLNLFRFLEVKSLDQSEEIKIIHDIFGKVDKNVHKVIELSHILRESRDPVLRSFADILSTRQLLKIAKKMAAYSSDDELYEIVQNIFLAKFMPSIPKAALEKAIEKAGICRPSLMKITTKTISKEGDLLKIGSTEMKVEPTDAESKVPNTLFYDVPQHIALLERLLQDFLIGENILLVGNQGVGKNKLIDKLLQLMNKPREYIQLHRDTTVHSLTVQSTLRDGKVIFEDSSLVKAVKNGHILVIDEADKAPVNVTCILRTLIENGEMILSDGRKIVPRGSTSKTETNIITHPNFRIIVLANRPGFPFLGNDFFATLGDVFSCHSVDNPLPDSEIYLLQQYAPSVPRTTLITLVKAFGELRSMADEGLLNYPYSTREVVNIVKHLEKYPNDSMSELIGNILDFDKHSPETLEQVTEVLIRHGLQIDAYAKDELFTLRQKKQLQMTVNRTSGLDVSSPKHGKIDPKNEPHVGGNTWAGGTGGRDTAGLGGKGGPYRLDAGHKVHQLSDEEKDAIPEEVKKAAKEMNRKAFEEKLREIKMSKHDASVYAQFSEPIRRQVQQLKAILDALQTKSKERLWQKYQTSGELDDTRLIEGITGEKNIYRKRGETNPWSEQVHEKPNRLKLVVDVSGSMYRFNGYDGRLDRQLEAMTMVMEAFEGYNKKICYDITGHSGEGHEIPFVMPGKPPKNNKERMDTIRMMHAHTQFCWQGDNTLKATKHAIECLADEDNETSIVVVLSDANLSRYGIHPKDLGHILMKGEPKVQAHVIFIGSFDDEADEISRNIPTGHSHICLDTAKLPQILKQIFTSALTS